MGRTVHVRAGAAPGSLNGAFLGARDLVIVIDESALDNPALATAVIAQLVALFSAGRPRFVSPDVFAETVLAEDATTRLAQRTRTGMDQSRARPAPIADHDKLIEDARLAWRYIDRFTIRRTGLCRATVQVSGSDIVTYDQLAMWDIGSQLQGIRSAFRLGLIDRADFIARAKAVITHLPHTRIHGRILPSALVRATDARTTRRAFFPSDVGRLLSALALLREEKELRDPIRRVVDRWQLAAMVKNGRLMEIDGGRESEFYMSQGAHYATRAFAAFGIKAASPYPEQGADSESDWQMRLLYAAGAISPLGPEPLLEEGIEMGFSAPAAYLAQVLFAAQLRSHEETGQIICPSESPLDRSPWFAYEGLRISDSAPRWAMQTGNDAGKSGIGTEETVPQVASSKAAYLWAAVHPHLYSTTMMDYIRARARVPDAGFASAVFVATGTQTQGYVDLNTNGVILSAIDHMLDRSR